MKKVAFSPQWRPIPIPRQLTTTPLRSALKTKPATSVPIKDKAEVAVPRELQTGVHQPKDGEQAYDFGKFF